MSQRVKPIEELKLQLYNNRLMSSYEEIELFEEALNALYEEKKIENISLFLSVLDDISEDMGLMFGVIHGLESYICYFGADTYFNAVFKSLTTLTDNSIGWQEVLFLRMINSEEYFNYLLQNVTKQGDVVKEKLKYIFTRIQQRDKEKFGLKCDLLLNILSIHN